MTQTPPADDDFFTKPFSQVVAEAQTQNHPASASTKAAPIKIVPYSDDDDDTSTVINGVRCVWDKTVGDYVPESAAQTETAPVKAISPRQRQPPILFSPEQIELIRGLHTSGFNYSEIAAYMRTQPGFSGVTDGIIRHRIARGPSKRQPNRVITAADIAKVRGGSHNR